ncbi:MAG: metal ABC transporter ATP-binding protein [Candidatus Kryptoniota bacterium]
MGEPLLEVKNLRVSFGNFVVIDGLSFSVREGEVLTVLGPNGAGKSVLLKALLGLVPYKGEVIWYKKPRIGYLPQGMNQLTVKDFPISVADFFALKNVSRDQILEHLALVGLNQSILANKAGNLSGGEFQRMLIAWVLVTSPEVIFFDEPTTGVDIGGGQTIYSLLHHIWEKQGLTILHVTHDLGIVHAHSTHVLCLSKIGHVCYGVPSEILTPEALRGIYGTDIKFYGHQEEGLSR